MVERMLIAHEVAGSNPVYSAGGFGCKLVSIFLVVDLRHVATSLIG